jgi:flagellar M-ring protein FliF
VNSPFTVETTVVAEVPLWKDREVLDLARSVGPSLAFAAAALFLWLAVLRPLLRRPAAQAARAEAPMQLAAADRAAQLAGSAAAPLELPASDPILERELSRRQANLEFAQQTATQDPRLAASLIRHWMNEP